MIRPFYVSNEIAKQECFLWNCSSSRDSLWSLLAFPWSQHPWFVWWKPCRTKSDWLWLKINRVQSDHKFGRIKYGFHPFRAVNHFEYVTAVDWLFCTKQGKLIIEYVWLIMIDFPTQFLFFRLKSFCLHRRWLLENVLSLREIRILPYWRDNKVLTFQSRFGMALIVHILLASIVQYVLRFYLAAGWLTMASLTSLTAKEPHSDLPWCHCAQDYLLDLTRPSALKLQQTLRDR